MKQKHFSSPNIDKTKTFFGFEYRPCPLQNVNFQNSLWAEMIVLKDQIKQILAHFDIFRQAKKII